MVNLSEAGSRLASYRMPDRTPSSDIRRRRNRRRHRRRLGIVIGVVAVVVVAVVGAIVGITRSPAVRHEQVTTSPPSTTVTADGQTTAAQLAGGRWSTVPPSPISFGDNPVVVWTGHELILWGGAAGQQHGAAYDPTIDRWTVLPPAPISGRSQAAAVWTGTEMVIWGGYENDPSTDSPVGQVSATGAAYNPTTNAWRLLSPSPLSARAGSQAVWTGRAMLVLGGHPAVIGNAGSDPDGALYDPDTNSWQVIAPPSPPAGHGLDWSFATQAGARTLAWSPWYITTALGPGKTSTRTGVDLFAYDERTGQWATIDQTSALVTDPDQAIPLGNDLFVRGNAWYCGPCAGPARPAGTVGSVSALFDPSTTTWTSIPADPIAIDHPQSTGTGAAIVSLDQFAASGTRAGPTTPGSASAYDPAGQRWVSLPPAPAACAAYEPPVWTGHRVIAVCATSAAGNAAGGISLLPTP